MSNLQSNDSDPLSMFRLDGRVAFLSGAAGLLGRPMARALASAGAHVVLNGRTQPALEASVEELKSLGLSASVACFDVTDESATRRHIDLIGEQYGRLDVLVNNASSGSPGTSKQATDALRPRLFNSS